MMKKNWSVYQRKDWSLAPILISIGISWDMFAVISSANFFEVSSQFWNLHGTLVNKCLLKIVISSALGGLDFEK